MVDGDAAEPARLQALLDAAPAPLQPLDASALDGYLCGVLLQPRRPAPEAWLPLVADVEGRAAPPGPWLDALQALARRRHRVLDDAIGARRWFDPWVYVVEADDDRAPMAGDGGVGALGALDDAGGAGGTGRDLGPGGERSGGHDGEGEGEGEGKGKGQRFRTGAETDGGGTRPAAGAGAGADAGADADADADAGATAEAATATAAAAEADADADAEAAADADDAAPDPSVTAAILPWVAGFATAMGRFPALLDHPDPALVEPLALLFLHLDPDDLEDADALLAVIETLAPPVDLAEAVQDLVRALMLMADVTRPPAGASRPAPRRPAAPRHGPRRR